MLSELLSPDFWFAFIRQWWLWHTATVLLGWLVFPFLFAWLRELPDRGYAIARIIGAFLLSYLNWLLCHRFFSFSIASLTTAAALPALLSIRGLWKNRRAFGDYLRRRWRWILATEALALFLFMFLINIRSFCADIQYNPGFHGAEKLGNMMLLNTLYTTEKFPAEDAWYCRTATAPASGRKQPILNYYYGAHLQWATLARLTHQSTQIAFNLALATLFSWIGIGAFGLMLNLTRRLTPSIICALILVFAGNLEPLRQVPEMWKAWREWRQTTGAERDFSPADFMMVRRYDFWRASRVILSISKPAGSEQDYVVDEFPYFSFILGDLHAHSSALPLTLALLNVLLALYYQKQLIGARWAEALLRQPATALLLAGLIGGLYFYNAWEILPCFLLLMIFLFWDQHDWRSGRARHIIESLLAGAILFSTGLFLLFGLFTTRLQTPWPSPGEAERSSIHYLTTLGEKIIFRPFDLGSSATELGIFWGLIWLPLLIALAAEAFRRLWKPWDQKKTFVFSIIIFLLALMGLVFSAPGAQICFLLVFLSAMYAWRTETDDANNFAARLMFAGFSIIFFAEIFVINDSMTGALERYNTVFKLYYPAWAVLTIAAVFFVWRQNCTLKEIKRPAARLALIFAVAILTGLGVIYPVMATWARTDGLYSAAGNAAQGMYPARPRVTYRQRTLDGIRFLGDPTEAPDDLAAILWLKKNIGNRSHILECGGQAYSYSGRIAAYTGLPTIIGWDNHELQWRGWDLYNEVEKRKADMNLAYSTTTIGELLPILLQYRIEYVIIGKLERATYPPAGLEKFSRFGKPVFTSGNTTIYDVRRLPRHMQLSPGATSYYNEPPRAHTQPSTAKGQ